MLAQRISLLSSSGTALAHDVANLVAATGRQVIDLAIGEVISEPPSSVREGAIAAIKAGVNRYTDSIGMPQLREAVATKLSSETGIDWTANHIVMTAGATQGLLDAILAVVNPGDEVVIVRPCWQTFASQVFMAGAKPLFVDARPPRYIPDIDAIRGAVTSQTKAIIINSPNNPTGAIYDRATLRAIGDIAIDYRLWIISDECYSSLVFTAPRHESIVMAHPGVRSQTILINAFSKELAVTGWRLGYLAAPPEIVSAAKKLQSHTTSNANVIAQHAILHHLEGRDGSFERSMHQRLSDARKAGLRILSDLSDVTPPDVDGAIFFYLDLSRLISSLPTRCPIRSTDDISRLLLEEVGVGSVAGGVFGDDNGLRLCFGAPPDLLATGLERVVKYLNSFKSRQVAI
ncbi:aminotransferase class I/II-fold pyridoxal phosphate-dependent enzyme [Bradyrhizobium sp. 14AA]